MKVLSLFDGMACGMVAMQFAGMEVESYDAYEIDKYAIKTAQHNFPMIKEHGDVFGADFTQYEGMDVREKQSSEKRLIDREALLLFEKMDAELCAT